MFYQGQRMPQSLQAPTGPMGPPVYVTGDFSISFDPFVKPRVHKKDKVATTVKSSLTSTTPASKSRRNNEIYIRQIKKTIH